MNNARNQRNYRWLSRIYDQLIQNRWFEQARQKEFALAKIKPHQRVLIVGIGTGLDLPYLPTEADITGIDISKEMMVYAKQRGKQHQLRLLEMNAKQLTFPDESFDVIIMNLILSVVENPQQAMKEAYRVLKPEGSIWIFDKFVTSDRPIGLRRRMLNWVTSSIGTDITRSLEKMITQVPLMIHHQEPAFWSSTYQIIQLKPV